MKKNALKHLDTNYLKVITGPMFSGKTTELLRTFKQYTFLELNSVIFSPTTDTRSGDYFIQSRDGYKQSVIKVTKPSEILDYCNLHKEVLVIGIDEVQFFDLSLIDVIKQLLLKDKIILVAGLDLNYKAEPFTTVQQLLSLADDVVKLKAFCHVCGNLASKTYLKNKNNYHNESVIIGDTETFEAGCNHCFSK